MRTFNANAAKTICIGLQFIAITPLLPVIALMHLIAWLGQESAAGIEANPQPVQPVNGGLVAGF